jgi:hypothetical protein
MAKPQSKTPSPARQPRIRYYGSPLLNIGDAGGRKANDQLSRQIGPVSLQGMQNPVGQLCRKNWLDIAYRMCSLISTDELIRKCQTRHKSSLLEPEYSRE